MGARSPRLRRWASLGLIALAAGIFTLLVVNWSLEHGRLSAEVIWDDTAYLRDGLERWRTFEAKGFVYEIRDLFHNPPHSPLSTTLAAISFALLGESEASPYRANVLAVLLLFLLSVRGGGASNGLTTSLTILATAAIPFTFYAVHEFRPDFFCALFLAGSILLALEAATTQSAPAHARPFAAAGILGALALFAKPPFFAHTIVLTGATAAYVAIVLRLQKTSWLRATSLVLSFFGAFALLGSLFLIWNFRGTVQYFFDNAFGRHSGLWRIPGGLQAAFVYNVVDGQAVGMVGRFGVVFFLVAAAFLPSAWGRDRIAGLRILGLLAASLISLGILLYGEMRDAFYALTHQLLLWFAFLQLFRLDLPVRRHRTILVSAFLLAALWQLTAPPPPIFAGIPPGLAKHSFNRRLLELIERDSRVANRGSRSNIFVTFAGSVNASTLSWMAELERRPLDFNDLHYSDDLNLYRQRFAASHYIIAPAPGAPGVYDWLPSAKIQDSVLRELAAPGYSALLSPSSDIPFYIFRNERLLGR